MFGIGCNPDLSASVHDVADSSSPPRSVHIEDISSDELYDQADIAETPSPLHLPSRLSYNIEALPRSSPRHPGYTLAGWQAATRGTYSCDEFNLRPAPISSFGGLRRYRTRRVNLAEPNGILCTDYPAPSAIRNSLQPTYRDREIGIEEFLSMRYTAVTVDPDDFTRQNGFDLRPRTYNRHTELFVAVTYYNEDKVLLSRTTHSIMQNIRDIINLKRSTFWNNGGPAWQKIVLCIVMDGVDPCDKGALDILATVGVFQQGVLKKEVNGEKTRAHIFEYTTQLSVTPKQQLIRPTDSSPQALIPPIQIMICLKAENSGKINSLRWVYNAFGRILNPNVVVHIDTGTKISTKSLLTLWEAFYNDKDLGGASGSLLPMLGKRGKGLLNPLVAFQNFEYKVSSQLEQALASSTGYLSVLPGAFSAYRFRAVMGQPLNEYYRGDPTMEEILGTKAASNSLYDLNRYLADDRVLPFHLVIKRGSKWRTLFVGSSIAETDVPTSTLDFINQRRRWLNGSLATSTYNLRMSYRLIFSGHSIPRTVLLSIQILHNLIAFLLSWFSLAGFLLTTFVVNDITGTPPAGAPVDGFPFGKNTPIVNSIIQIIYLATVMFQFVIALGSRSKSHVLTYTISFSIFAIIQVYLFINLINLAKRIIEFKLDTNGSADYAYISEYYTDIGEITILATAISLFGIYIAAGFLCLDPWHLFHSWAQYLFVSSAYVNIIKTYAFSNFQDASWGHKSGKKLIRVTPVTPVPIQTLNTGDEAFEQMELGSQDIDSQFENIVKRALTPFKAEMVSVEDNREEKFMNFRIKLVAVYVFSNFFLCLVVMNDSFKSLSWLGDPYWHKIWFFRIYLWANSGLLMLQFVGCVYQKFSYFVFRCFARH
ncbi:glycosyltransferase family 2 protein [Xylaria telfairii]|nr:glycosyltransferase family 2 protein [Xylaria telfairii]